MYIGSLSNANAEVIKFVKVTDAIFSDIQGLTCEAYSDGTKPTTLRLNGSAPGRLLNVFGMVHNPTDYLAEISITGGFMRRVPEPSEDIDNYIASTSLAFGSAIRNGRLLLKPQESKTLHMSVLPKRINSDGYYVSELENIDPITSNDNILIDSGSQGMVIHATITNMESGEKVEASQFTTGIDYYIEAEEIGGWIVDGKKFDWSNAFCS